MIPLKRRWYGQGDIRVAHNPELLDLAARSGCKWIFVGFESTNPDNLKAMKKEKINIVEQYAESISLVHQKGSIFSDRLCSAWIMMTKAFLIAP